ncbi:hypothetical protein ACWCV5_27945 [Streptomyces tubercidicus]
MTNALPKHVHEAAIRTSGAPAALLPPAMRASLTDVVDHLWEKEERDFADQDDDGQAGHIFTALRLLRSYLDTPTPLRVRDASITVADAIPEYGTPSDVYEIDVFGISVLIRRRAQWGAATDVPYVHIEDQNNEPGLLLVEVNNAGEHEHPRFRGVIA